MVIKNLLVKIGADVSEYERAFKNAQSNLKNLGAGLQKVGMGLTAAVTLPLVGVGVAATKMALDVDDAMDTIRAGTGATGEALASLEASAKAVARSVPQNIMEVSKVIADLHTRTGLAGPALEDLARRTLDAARLMGVDSVQLVASFTRTLGDWRIELKDAPAALDVLFAASQTTGVGLDQLNQSIVRYGAPLRQMGFDFETAAALIGKFEKEGVNAELVMGSLRIALGNMAREGKPVVESFRGMLEQIKATGDTSEANRLALELFGARAGPDMAAAIREGRFELDELVAKLQASSGALQSANADTRGFAEIWSETKNKITLALEPLGKMFLKIAEDWLPPLADIVEAVARAFSKIPGPVQAVLIVLAGLAAALGPLLVIIGKLIFLAPQMGAAWTMLTGPIGLVALAIAGLVTAGVLVYKNWEKIKGWFVTLWTYLKTFFVAVWKTIAGVLGPIVQGIIDAFSGLFSALKTIALAIGNTVVGAFRWLRDSAVSIFQAVADFVISKLLWLMEQIAKIPIVKKFVKNLQEGLAAAKASIAESRERMKESTEGMADDAKSAGEKIGASYDGIGESAEQMKAVVSTVHAELLDVVKKGTLSEIEYARWAAEEAYAARKKAIAEELTDARARDQELRLLAQARAIELAAIEKSFQEERKQEEQAFLEEVKTAEAEWWAGRLAAAQSFQDQRAKLIDAVKQMTLSELEYKRWALEQERLAEEARILSQKELSTKQKEELLALLADYYAKKRAQAEADASAEVALVEETETAITGILNAGIENILGAFEEFGAGAKSVFASFGAALKATVGTAISALKDLVKAVLKTAIENIAASQSEAIASVIASVMKLPFPLNLLTVGGAIAAVSALFSAIKLGEGGLVTGPTLALVGEAGPEMVIPLNKLGAFAGGPAGGGEGPSITLNLNSPLIQTTGLSRGQVDELAPYLFDAVEGEARRYGFSLRRGR